MIKIESPIVFAMKNELFFLSFYLERQNHQIFLIYFHINDTTSEKIGMKYSVYINRQCFG